MNCGTCKWWKDGGFGAGDCHLNPPVRTQHGWARPRLAQNDFCSHWTDGAKETVAKLKEK